jgi:hypothetical protein
VLLLVLPERASATNVNSSIGFSPLEIVLEEVKFNCSEFKPNIITKFLWREGPTRELLYKKCLDQSSDDAAFTKYNESMINDSNISQLSADLKNAQTRLTILTLTTALKNYLIDESTNDDKLEMIKGSVDGFRQHYVEKKAKLDKEIKFLKKNENMKNKKTLELLKIIEESEEELGSGIESTIKYMEFVLKDRHAFVSSHHKFLPHIYVRSDDFVKMKLSKYECEFLELNFGSEWVDVKKDLKLICLKN